MSDVVTKKRILRKKFKLSSTAIEPRTSAISEAQFQHAVIEFLTPDPHRKSRLGDLLREFRRRFGQQSLRRLFSLVYASTGFSKSHCQNCMSFSKRVPAAERSDPIPDEHYEEIVSLKDLTARTRLLAETAKGFRNGKGMALTRLREKVSTEKKRTGQEINKGRKSATND
jgi:hypothetical protein